MFEINNNLRDKVLKEKLAHSEIISLSELIQEIERQLNDFCTKLSSKGYYKTTSAISTKEFESLGTQLPDCIIEILSYLGQNQIEVRADFLKQTDERFGSDVYISEERTRNFLRVFEDFETTCYRYLNFARIDYNTQGINDYVTNNSPKGVQVNLHKLIKEINLFEQIMGLNPERLLQKRIEEREQKTSSSKREKAFKNGLQVTQMPRAICLETNELPHLMNQLEIMD